MSTTAKRALIKRAHIQNTKVTIEVLTPEGKWVEVKPESPEDDVVEGNLDS